MDESQNTSIRPEILSPINSVDTAWFNEIDSGLMISSPIKMVCADLTSDANSTLTQQRFDLNDSSFDKEYCGDMEDFVEDCFNMLKTDSPIGISVADYDFITDENFKTSNNIIMENVKSDNYSRFENTFCVDEDEKHFISGGCEVFMGDNSQVDNDLLVENESSLTTNHCISSKTDFFQEIFSQCNTDSLDEKMSLEISESFVKNFDEFFQLIEREDERAETLQTGALSTSPICLSSKCTKEADILMDSEPSSFNELNNSLFKFGNSSEFMMADALENPGYFENVCGTVVETSLSHSPFVMKEENTGSSYLQSQHHDTNCSNTTVHEEYSKLDFNVSLVGGFKSCLPVPFQPVGNDAHFTFRNKNSVKSLPSVLEPNLKIMPLISGLNPVVESDKSSEHVSCCLEAGSTINLDSRRDVKSSASSDLSLPVLSSSYSCADTLQKSLEMTCDNQYDSCNTGTKKQKTISVLSYHVQSESQHKHEFAERQESGIGVSRNHAVFSSQSRMCSFENSNQIYIDSGKKRKFTHVIDTKETLPLTETRGTTLWRQNNTSETHAGISHQPVNMNESANTETVMNNYHEKGPSKHPTNISFSHDNDRDTTIAAGYGEKNSRFDTCESLDDTPQDETINIDNTYGKPSKCTCHCVNVGMKNKFVRLRVRDMWNMNVKDMLHLAGHTPKPKNINEIAREKRAEKNMLLKRKEQRLLLQTQNIF